MHLSNNQKMKIDHLPPSVSWNQSPQSNKNSVPTGHSHCQKTNFPLSSPTKNTFNNKNFIQSDEKAFWKSKYLTFMYTFFIGHCS